MVKTDRQAKRGEVRRDKAIDKRRAESCVPWKKWKRLFGDCGR